MSPVSRALPLPRRSQTDAARLTPARLAAAVQSRTAGRDDGARDCGMTTAEYAVGTVAACGFSGVLYKVITSPSVLELIKGVIEKAFHLGF
jgi:hypothetical protein